MITHVRETNGKWGREGGWLRTYEVDMHPNEFVKIAEERGIKWSKITPRFGAEWEVMAKRSTNGEVMATVILTIPDDSEREEVSLWGERIEGTGTETRT